MTVRAVALGLALGLLISVGTYFNDWVIGQTQLIGNHLPVSVFGIAALLLFFVIPALRACGWRRALGGREVLVTTAIALAACGWPGSGYYRGFTTVAALPAHWLKTTPAWQANAVMSYVPGASAELGQGHVQDWPALCAELERAATGAASSPARRLWEALTPEGRRLFAQAQRAPGTVASLAPELTRALNEALRKPDLYDSVAFAAVAVPPRARALLERAAVGPHEATAANRALLVAAFPQIFLPPPPGGGLLVAEGRADPFVVDTLLQGRSRHQRLGLGAIPWRAWLPTIGLWGSLALLLGICALAMALIVHPQWSRRELLPYPIVRFLEEAAVTEPGRRLPEVARSRLFWMAFVTLVAIHGLNGLHAWFPEVPAIPNKLDFGPFDRLFPNAVRIDGQYGWFTPTIYLSVIAFSFFLSTNVSFSLGISHLLFFALGSALIVNGVQIDSGLAGRSNMLRTGAYLAVAILIAYTGRRYFANVAASALGWPRAAETPRYATGAMRVLAAATLASVLVLRTAGLSVPLAAGFVALVLVTFLVVARIVTETGAFFVNTSWLPVGALVAAVGFEAIGPTGFIVLALASVMLIIDSRELLMPYLANGLKLADREGGAPPPRLAPWLLAMMLVGFVAAGVVTLYLQYNHSVTQVGNSHGTHTLPRYAFDAFVRYAAESSAEGRLAAATGAAGFARLGLIRPDLDALGWLAGGFALAFLAAALRLRLPWWPLHPVAFLVWDTYPIIMFGPSFLLGWMVKSAVVGTSGARGYHAVKPLMVGVIAGELLSGLGFMVIGAAYYFVTGRTPVAYSIFPP